MGSCVKNRNKTLNKMLAGKITVEEAQQRIGGKAARKLAAPAVTKAASGQRTRDELLAAMREATRPMTEEDVRAAARDDMSELREHYIRKARQAAAARPPRQDPPMTLKAVLDMQAAAPPAAAIAPPARPVQPWLPKHTELWRVAHEHSNPETRLSAMAVLQQEGVLPWAPPDPEVKKSVRAMVQVRGPDGRFTWLPVQEQQKDPGLQIAPPGIAGR
jgi:hypothetical protein